MTTVTGDLQRYLVTLANELRAENATEHTHRPALKLLLEAIEPGITATNEPWRIACGAPDYVITRDGFTVGYVEAKDVGASPRLPQRGQRMHPLSV